MKNPGTLLMLQSLLCSLQVFNAGLATVGSVPPLAILGVASIVAGFQFYVQHRGNQLTPPTQ